MRQRKVEAPRVECSVGTETKFEVFYGSTETVFTVHQQRFTIKTGVTHRPRPDVLALICLSCFLPPAGTTVCFPEPVSQQFAQCVGEKPFCLGTKGFETFGPEFASSFEKRSESFELAKNLVNNVNVKSSDFHFGVAFSGGYDSLAVYRLLTEIAIKATFFFQVTDPVRDPAIISLGQDLSSRKSSEASNLDSDQTVPKEQFVAIETVGVRDRVKGWSNWTAVLVPLLLVSEDHGLTHLVLGGNLGSVFLNGGSRYHPSHRRPSQWYRLFQAASIPMFCPLAGVSEVGVVKILQTQPKLFEKAIYCQKKDGRNCGKCAKCVRRITVRDAVINAVKQHVPVARKNTVKQRVPVARNVKTGPSLEWAKTSERDPAQVPERSMRDPESQIPERSMRDPDWLACYYPRGIDFQPAELQTLTKSLLERFLPVMDERQCAIVESYGL